MILPLTTLLWSSGVNLDKVVEWAAILAFLALGSREDLSTEPCVKGCLGDTFLFATYFMKEDRVGSELDSAGAL